MSRSFASTADVLNSTANPLDTGGDFSVQAWLYPTNPTAGTLQVFLCLGRDSNNGGVSFDINASGNWDVILNGVQTFDSGVAATANAWSHFVITYVHSNITMTLYINGSQVYQHFPAFATITAGQTVVGAQLNSSSSGYTRGFLGRIAQVGLWNTALTSGNVSTLYGGTVGGETVASANVQGFWRLCGVASPEPDVSSNNNALTVTGTSSAADPPGITTGCTTACVLPARYAREEHSIWTWTSCNP